VSNAAGSEETGHFGNFVPAQKKGQLLAGLGRRRFSDIKAESEKSQKCFLAKALPEWLLRYFSKATAFSLERKAKAFSIRKGRNLEV
jgi:hypothetical protein